MFLKFKRLIFMSSHDEFRSYVLSFLKIIIIYGSRQKITCSKRKRKKDSIHKEKNVYSHRIFITKYITMEYKMIQELSSSIISSPPMEIVSYNSCRAHRDDKS